VRIRLALLLAYRALPIDLVPDFISVVGYADDALCRITGLTPGNAPPATGQRRDQADLPDSGNLTYPPPGAGDAGQAHRLASARRECLDRMLATCERHLRLVLSEYLDQQDGLRGEVPLRALFPAAGARRISSGLCFEWRIVVSLGRDRLPLGRGHG
jgi:Protein of unknown function (DUF1232)